MKKKETVTKIIDGDTFETSSRKHPVRLANIDTPEKRQDGYMDAKKALSNLILGKQVIVEPIARDVYGRAVANVKIDNKSVNNQMKKYKK